MSFTQSDIKKLQKRGLKITGNTVSKKRIKVKRVDCKQVVWMEREIRKFCFDNLLYFKKEFKFSGKRKFRFDFAIMDSVLISRTGIEYDGLNSEKSRHTTLKGFTRDTEKFNLASLEGWKILRYTSLNYKNVIKDLKQLIS
jgi:hypothetical protein